MAKYCLFTATSILDEDVDAYTLTAPRRVACWKNLRVAKTAHKKLQKKLFAKEHAQRARHIYDDSVFALLCRGA